MLRCNNVMVRCHISAQSDPYFAGMDMALHLRLDDGTPVLLRPITLADEGRLRAGIDQFSERSRYLRFFSGIRRLPDPVVRRLADADGHHHIAWGAMVPGGDEADQPRAVAAAHAIRDDDGPEAELAFGVLDDFHGKGLARLLIAAVMLDCVHEGVERLVANVLTENRNASRLLRHFGASAFSSDGAVTQYSLPMDEALTRLHEMGAPKALPKLISTISGHGRHTPGWAA